MKTCELKAPVEHAGATYNRVTLRRVTVGDLAAQERVEGDLAKVITMIARLSGLPEEIIEKIDMADFNVLSTLMADIMAAPVGEPGAVGSTA